MVAAGCGLGLRWAAAAGPGAPKRGCPAAARFVEGGRREARGFAAVGSWGRRRRWMATVEDAGASDLRSSRGAGMSITRESSLRFSRAQDSRFVALGTAGNAKTTPGSS
ncbi:hypothetical protein MLD38_034940 [Melastoma candidum]|uniref:Uncharacterized protein n=1 Tax=Melastoma candidum TaxID=119954 RepID=A0ACB9MFB2_9MYRT|nr:hypothetical protein MLD38_034940 [Melastoma candidum]